MDDAWDYGPGNVDDAGTWNTQAYQDSSAGNIDFGSGWSGTLQGIAGVLANTYAQTQLMQTNQNGQRYIEGQRIAAVQSVGGIPTNLVVWGAVGFVLYKLLSK